MAVTENTFTQASGDGTNRSFTFEYLKQSDVKVTVAGVAKTNPADWTFHNATTVKFNTAPANGSFIRIYRETADTTLAATFYAGSAIKSQDLNDNFTQNLYVTQEVRDASETALANSREHDGDGTYTTAIAKANTAVTTANAADTIADNAKLATDRLVATTSNNGATWTLAGNNTNASTDPKGVGYAVTQSEAAVSTANDADTNATTALNNSRESDGSGGFNSAISIANTAKSTANTASSNATTALNNSRESDGSGGYTSAIAKASAASTTAGTASTNASNAVNTANSADANATTALNNSRESDGSGGFNSAISIANTAKTNADTAKLASDRLVATTSNGGNTWTLAGNNTNASTDPKGVGYAVTTAEAASATATAAQSAVANSVLYTPVAAVANIPGSPSDDDYVEVSDSTGIESFSPLAGLPSGFTGDSGLTVKIRYTDSGSTWNYQSYHANDSEDRYIGVYGKHNTTQVSYIVKVVTKTAAHRYHGTGSSSGYTIGGIESPFLTLIPGNTYRFDQSDSSNSGHPLAFYKNADKTGAWTTNVTTNGTAGQTGAYTQIEIVDTTPGSLSYQCSNHAYMGNGTTTNTGTGGAGATGGGNDQIFSENDQVMTTSYSISANKNASCVGPVALNSSVVLTIPSTSKLLVLN